MHKHLIAIAICALASLTPLLGSAEPYYQCPKTLGADKLLGPPFPESENWYGSEALAVILPLDGIWATTGEGALIAVKLFWWSSGFEPGMEQNLTVETRNLSGGKNDAVVSSPTNARLGTGAPDTNDWAMLTGIDFPTPGCWEIVGRYLGQTITFVVEVVEVEQYLQERDKST